MSWTTRYRERCMTAEEAVSFVKSGDNVHIHPGCAIPTRLVNALSARGPELQDVEIIHILTFNPAPYIEESMKGHFHHTALFTGANVREAVNDGRADYVPVFLSEIPALFRHEYPIDVSIIHVSPPDEHGFCSYGIGAEVTKPATEAAKMVIAQVNPRMPRVHGDNFIHVSKIKAFVEVDDPLVEIVQGTVSDRNKNIGQNVASLIEDGSTLQMGIGGIPDAVLLYLEDKRDLGIHTEMFSDGVVKLVEEGVITNDRKTLHPGKLVASFCMGSRQLYDFVADNPLIEFHPSDYVNDPFNVAKNDNMVAINSALSVDLTGQVNSDSIGTRIYSGFGGQVDFIRGAARSKGGKPIIALPATAKGDAMSRIVPTLAPGAGVVTSRADVHYVVTEFGVAYLHGKSLRQRAQTLIDISAPQFREELTAEARRLHYI
jgi:4-hydroxybutyrate CoA-transferase